MTIPELVSWFLQAVRGGFQPFRVSTTYFYDDGKGSTVASNWFESQTMPSILLIDSGQSSLSNGLI